VIAVRGECKGAGDGDKWNTLSTGKGLYIDGLM
jgi:hypothetical protein